MSTMEQPTVRLPAVPRRRALRDPAALVTAAAGALLLAGLATVLADPDAIEAALALTGAGAVLALFLLVPLGVAALRRHPMWLAVPIVPFGLYAAALALGTPYFVASVLGPVAVLVAVVLLADDLRGRLSLDAGGPTPWQRLTGTAGAPPLAAGVIALAVVLFAFVVSWYTGTAGVLLVLVVVGVPVGVALFARSDRDRVQAAREDARMHVAAHLHDSVLQTLALVQRQAHDPRSVVRLARRQEHELRAWMAGEVELGAETLSAALREAVAEVEDAHDLVVEVSVLGDRLLDRQGEALAAAAREALRNAARHAPGAPHLRVRRAGRERRRGVRPRRGPRVRDRGGPVRAPRRARRDPRPDDGGRRSGRGRLRARRGHRGHARVREHDVSERLRIAVVDDHHLFRAGVRAELAAHHDVVADAATVADALAAIAATAPDVVLLDVHLPDGGGVAVLEALARTEAPPRVLALSVSDAAEDVVPMIRAGALGYVTKTLDTPELLAAIATVAAGEACFSPRLAAFVLQAFSGAAPPDELDTLTPREREVLHHLARGYAYKRIAGRLGISVRTVESHVGSVLRKLQLSSRHEVSHWAATRGLIGD